MIRILLKFLYVLTAISLVSCSDDDNPADNPFADINVVVKSRDDSSIVTNANVILYNASNGNAVMRASSGNNGTVVFANATPGTFYVKISAQNFEELPPENITPVPFSASAGQTSTITYYMSAHPGQLGMISGYVNPKVAGLLVKAADLNGTGYSTYTGPDGYYAIFNLPFSQYLLTAFRNGYRSTETNQVTISLNQSSAVKDITITQFAGASLNGSVTFLAVNNGIVDVSLLDNQSKSAVTGLAAKINEARAYNITGIPKGDYLAWASFQNDGYVMDPDWIFKNPGGLNISFQADSGSKTLNFSVTGAINLIAPTNLPASVIPVDADSTIPLFSWTAYSAAKEYIIEVRDLNGTLIWGGYNSDGTIRHTQIPKEKTSIRFNFDGSASSQLVSGEIYQWKIYADDDANQNIQTLLSSSEDLMGVFRAK